MGEISARIRFYYDKGTDSVEAHKKLLVLWLKCIVGKNGPKMFGSCSLEKKFLY